MLSFAIITLACSLAPAAEYVPQTEEERAALGKLKAELGVTLSAPEPASAVPHVPEQVVRARELRDAKAYKLALEEYCAAYDSSTARRMFSVAVLVPREIARLGKDYPPALAELKRRRDAAKAKALGNSANTEEAQDYGWISSALGDSGAALKLWNQFPAGDPRRRAIGGQVYVQLVDEKRYAEAVEAHPFESMIDSMEMTRRSIELSGNTGARYVRIMLDPRARDIEVLVGAGKLEEAWILRDRLLSIDGSESTKEMIKAHLKRAGYVAAAGRN